MRDEIVCTNIFMNDWQLAHDFKVKGGGVFSGVKCEYLPPPPKVSKFTFFDISSFLLMLSAQNFFW